MADIIIAGDFVPQYRVIPLLNNNEYEVIFGKVKDIISASSYSIVNLESPLTDEHALPIRKTGPNLKCSAKVIDAIKYIGFKCVTLANNHFYDYGEEGVAKTLSICESSGVETIGGGENIRHASKILYKDINGKRFAFINICEHEWSIASENKGGSAPLDIIKNFHQIITAKQHADYVIIIVHGGIEHYNLPTLRMKKTYRFFIDVGADVVVNHHQHCFSGFENYNGKYIFYGLGNFCFDKGKQHPNAWNKGYLLKLTFNRHLKFELIPYIQCAIMPEIDFNIDSAAFIGHLKQLNTIIENDKALLEEYDQFINSKSNGYLTSLEPYSINKYLHSLRYKHLIPSFLSTSWLRLILALFRCESHRDNLLYILDKKISK